MFQINEEKMKKLEAEKADDDLVSLCLSSDIDLRKYNGRYVHDTASMRRALNYVYDKSNKNKIISKTFGSLKDEDIVMYDSIAKALYFLAYIKNKR